MAGGFISRLAAGLFRRVNRRVVWHRLPFVLSVANLLALRVDLRARNLFDTETDPQPPVAPAGHDILRNRTADGSFNDLAKPWMGMAGTRFGRNAPLAETFGEAPPGLYEPNPREVSRKLLARKEFIPATSVNALLAAWLQFMVHDWLSHGSNVREDPHVLPRPEGDNWPAETVTVLRTRPDPITGPRDEGRARTFRNTVTHWWDGSQIYGSDLEAQRRVRSAPNSPDMLPDGKIYLDPSGHLPRDTKAGDPDQEFAAVNGNWWLGLSIMHTLFAREHNAIIDRLKIDHPQKDGEWLFQKARLINAALIIKIHATEWTPALLQSPALQFAMRGSWWGVLGEEYFRANGRPARSEVLSGIPASPQEHHAAPYAITEEFTSVYRLHSLVPDDFSIRSLETDRELARCTLFELIGGGPTRLYRDRNVSFADAVYSMGTSYSGAPVLHNFPTHLRKIPEKPEQNIFNDAASIDILRDRERGVPRYCAFRQILRMSVPTTFAELTDNPQWQRELEEVYGTVDKVDLLAGVHAERKPDGFAISDTAFRIFVLMAGRRIKSDRFLTDAYNEDVYTPGGLAWVENNGMREVLLRHLPAIAPAVADIRNVFFPWTRAGA